MLEPAAQPVLAAAHQKVLAAAAADAHGQASNVITATLYEAMDNAAQRPWHLSTFRLGLFNACIIFTPVCMHQVSSSHLKLTAAGIRMQLHGNVPRPSHLSETGATSVLHCIWMKAWDEWVLTTLPWV